MFLEVLGCGQWVFKLKNVHEMKVLGDPNLEVSSIIGQAMKRLRFVEVRKVWKQTHKLNEQTPKMTTMKTKMYAIRWGLMGDSHKKLCPCHNYSIWRYGCN